MTEKTTCLVCKEQRLNTIHSEGGKVWCAGCGLKVMLATGFSREGHEHDEAGKQADAVMNLFCGFLEELGWTPPPQN